MIVGVCRLIANHLHLAIFESTPEVRVLPSARITRLQRSYDPVRLPPMPPPGNERRTDDPRERLTFSLRRPHKPAMSSPPLSIVTGKNLENLSRWSAVHDCRARLQRCARSNVAGTRSRSSFFRRNANNVLLPRARSSMPMSPALNGATCWSLVWTVRIPIPAPHGNAARSREESRSFSSAPISARKPSLSALTI